MISTIQILFLDNILENNLQNCYLLKVKCDIGYMILPYPLKGSFNIIAIEKSKFKFK
ncbi:MAG: hypothetical protein BAJALOKI3v1_30085 [Promethearchaeota archaeon]|nr:MAG: hypothetical protein BAJALOKI3v1_30085 [Candidatus Lokiarchaeota archaeon]